MPVLAIRNKLRVQIGRDVEDDVAVLVQVQVGKNDILDIRYARKLAGLQGDGDVVVEVVEVGIILRLAGKFDGTLAVVASDEFKSFESDRLVGVRLEVGKKGQQGNMLVEKCLGHPELEVEPRHVIQSVYLILPEVLPRVIDLRLGVLDALVDACRHQQNSAISDSRHEEKDDSEEHKNPDGRLTLAVDAERARTLGYERWRIGRWWCLEIHVVNFFL